jgi:hypothetical protein
MNVPGSRRREFNDKQVKLAKGRFSRWPPQNYKITAITLITAITAITRKNKICMAPQTPSLRLQVKDKAQLDCQWWVRGTIDNGTEARSKQPEGPGGSPGLED